MGKSYLLPHRFKKLGWVLLIFGFVLGLTYQVLDWFDVDLYDFFEKKMVDIIYLDFNNKILKGGLLDELIAILIIIGGIIVGFSKTKVEDEFINQLRLSSLVWAVYVSYGVLFFAVIFIYDMAFFNIMSINMFTVLLFFVARFHVLLYKANKSVV